MTKKQQQQLMTQAESVAGSLPKLADAIGVNSSTVYRWLNGTRRMHGIAIRTVQGYIDTKGGK
jgi:DNA-binding transcriptional regulator YdaS (Cro superfamily)